ncbi:MAG: type II toxin-antitoxin system VapC family toxin [Planctomycetota bacterium]|nr:type II toxin-antitoxin system VapC family toxin [Planctomycetota bacterium]
MTFDVHSRQDLIIIIQRNANPELSRLRERMARHPVSAFYMTVISTHEQMMGANSYISRAKKPVDVARGYRLIETAMLDYENYRILPFDEPAGIQFEEFRKQGVRIGTMDLRIASIAISHDFTVLTRNLVDFEKVPGLQVEDWTIAP